MNILFRIQLLIALLLAPGLGIAAPAPRLAAPRVKIDSGVVEGVPFGVASSGAAFLGIPYAAPPTGHLRWKPPQPVGYWRNIRAARELGPSCPQQPDRAPRYWRVVVAALGGNPGVVRPLGPTSEDCLSLNIWTSNFGGKTKQPVLVWIHGGGFVANRGGEEPAVLAMDGAVVVTINYRLGVLGFLAHPALTKESPYGSSGNYGLLDQIEALRWIKRNIAAFGGDPNRVTLLGHSSGGVAVFCLLSSPLAQGLFHRAIVQSGAPESPLQTLTAAEAAGQQFVKGLASAGADPLTALRAASIDMLQSMTAAQSFSPVRDEWVVTSQGEQGSRGVPMIVGAATNEFANLALLFPQSVPKDGKAYRALVEQVGPPWNDRLLAMYPANNDDAVQGTAISYLTDRNYICPSRRIAATRGGHTWLYIFSASPAPTSEGRRLGAFHGADMRLMFNLDYGIPVGDAGRRVGDAMRRYWIQFAATGDPNEKSLPEWPPYWGEQPHYLDIGDSIRSVSGPVRESCDVFDKVRSR